MITSDLIRSDVISCHIISHEEERRLFSHCIEFRGGKEVTRTHAWNGV